MFFVYTSLKLAKKNFFVSQVECDIQRHHTELNWLYERDKEKTKKKRQLKYINL